MVLCCVRKQIIECGEKKEREGERGSRMRHKIRQSSASRDESRRGEREGAKRRKPKLFDLKEASEIEQDAGLVLRVYNSVIRSKLVFGLETAQLLTFKK